MSPPSDADKATLVVQVSTGPEQRAQPALPVQIRRLSMVVAQRGLTGAPLPVDAGEYLVTMTLPNGAELFQRTTVAAGETRTVQFTAPARPDPILRPRSATRSRNSRAVASRAAGAGPGSTVFLRLLGGNPMQPPMRTIGACRISFPGDPTGNPGLPLHDLPLLPSPPGTATGGRWVAPGRCQLQVQLPTARPVYWLRVTAPPDRTRFVAVPALAGEHCTLLMSRSGERRDVTVDFQLADPRLDALMRYRQGSDALQARAMLGALLPALADASPLSRAILGYAALRLGVEREAGYGAALFVRSTSTLPDASIIEAEFLSRRGEHARARELFAHACDTGLPMFSDGLGYLSSRLPQYVRIAAAGANDSGLGTAWARLLPFVAAADLKPVFMTLRGNVLAYTDRP